jgi:hypothetical protein
MVKSWPSVPVFCAPPSLLHAVTAKPTAPTAASAFSGFPTVLIE